MKVFRLAAVIALLTGPAYAQQMPNINLIPETTSKTPERTGAGGDPAKGLQGIAEENTGRQDPFRSVGHRA